MTNLAAGKPPVPEELAADARKAGGARGTRGIEIGPGTGKGRFRVRQQLVADHYVPLIAGKSYGAVKLDILLRCIALLPDHAGRREPGYVLHDWRYEDLHDLIKPEPNAKTVASRSEQAATKLKRKWIANQLHKLQDRNLVRVTERPGSTPQLIVLRDDGTGDPYDDPGALPVSYFTIHGSLIAKGEFRAWGAPEVAAYFACLLAELHHDRGAGREIQPGHGIWWRPLAWFRTNEWDSRRRLLLPFSTSLLEQGLSSLGAREMMYVNRVTRNPRDKRRLPRPRNVYQNRFDRFDRQVPQSHLFDDFLFEFSAEHAAAPVQKPPNVADVVIEGVARTQKRRTPPARSR